jgi:hypothetical protein
MLRNTPPNVLQLASAGRPRNLCATDAEKMQGQVRTHTTPHVDSHSAWRRAMPLPAALRNSHPNSGRVSLIFVADPRTARLCRISDAVSASTQSFEALTVFGLRGWLEVELDEDPGRRRS